MKILQIGNTGGTPYEFSRALDRLYGITSLTIHNVLDETKEYMWLHTVDEPKYLRVIKGVANFRRWLMSNIDMYDIIHVHYHDWLLPVLSVYGKPLVMTYHGTDIRRRWETRKPYYRKADLVTITTPDLLEGAPKDVTYVPNPVDTERFRPGPGGKGVLSIIYTSRHDSTVLDDIRNVAKRYSDMPLTVYDRSKDQIWYRDMPEFLGQYDVYIDVKKSDGIVIDARSLTALQALAMGLIIVDADGKQYRKSRRCHEVGYGTAIWKQLYECVMDSV